MIIDARETKKLERLTQWHPWFAWRPVTTLDGERVWMQTVYRMAICGHWGLKREFKMVYRLTGPAEGAQP